MIVDVGYKSEGIISVDEFLDETGEVTQPGVFVDVLLEGRKIATATSFSPAKKPRR